ncbi:MAG: glycosyltransferase family A protein [Bacteroidota bacterium]|nr:glycosyltransferase family A protein [Bacteroidota bacterium]
MKAQLHPTINVLMSTYNTPFNMSKRAIDSVLNQDFQDFELIVLDDGSDFETSVKLLEYVQKFENKISYFRHKNRGQSNSINRGIQLCNSSFISVIDADDEYKSNHLSNCLKAMTDYDLVATHTDTIVNVAEDYYVPDKYNNNHTIHVDDCILFATLFGKTEVFKKINFENKYAADSAFYEQVSKKFKVAKLPMRTYIYYRNHSNSITANMKLHIE